MIQCKHKWPMQVTNRGLNMQFCSLHIQSVNDDICSNCPDREGIIPVEVKFPLEFPQRTPEEIDSIYSVCKSCPLLSATKVCNKMLGETHPTDIVAQHPSNHCPEGYW